MKECSKSIPRRLRNPNFLRRYFQGHGVDIGGKPDPLALYQDFFPLINSVKIWDIEDGDAQFMGGVPDESYDFVHSSHCLEHLQDPFEGLKNWSRILKPGGYMVVTVPDEDLYEQGVFPSTYNRDHKWTFTIYKKKSWSSNSINLLELIIALGSQVRIEKIELLSDTYRFDLPRYDQTQTPISECGIEFILRKATMGEVEKGIVERTMQQPAPQLRVHFNQYIHDHQTMKDGNKSGQPFMDEKKI